MKVKKFLLANLVLAVFSLCFTACNQEEDNNDLRKSTSSTENPFNYVGQIHNQQLDQFIFYLRGNKDFSTLDVYNFNVTSNAFQTSEYPYSIFKSDLDTLEDVVYDFLFVDSTAFNRITNSEIINRFMQEYRTILLNAISTGVAITPTSFTQSISCLEAQAVDSYNRSEDLVEINDYARVLIAFAVAKASYEYWYSATFDEANPWYDIVHSKLKDCSLATKSKFGDFFKKVVNAVVDYIVAPLAAGCCDVGGIFVGVYKNCTIYLPKTPGSIGIGVYVDPQKVAQVTASISGNVYKNVTETLEIK